MSEKNELVVAQALAVKTGLILPNDDILEIVSEAVKGIAEDGDIERQLWQGLRTGI
ncbi:hypothetical protein [Caldanaerobacter subterraneus]|uniref:hypothetical protein n=1 Tax=Caldanaerobacter subterraneus TaxID=911092 RepID=UPI001F0E88BB|nr:hypothetical protein [Caldanaerobacter subterraneus]